MTETSGKINEPSSPQLETCLKEKDYHGKRADNNAPTMNPEVDDQAVDSLQPKDAAPQGTFEMMPFANLMAQYDYANRLPPSVEMSQAFLMTNNMKQAAA